MEEEISGHRGGEGLLAGQGGVSAGFQRRGPGEATNSAMPTGQWGGASAGVRIPQATSGIPQG